MRKIIGIIGSILAVAVMSFGIFISVVLLNQKAQTDTYVNAMEEFRIAINSENPDVDIINQLVEEIKSDGYFSYVELGAKIYLRDVFVPFLTAQNLRQKDIFKNGINKDLIEKEQPEFEQSLADIAEMRKNATLVKDGAELLFNKENAMSYLQYDGGNNENDPSKLDDYYVELFDDQVHEIYEDQQMKDNYAVFATYLLMQCNAYEEVINFLKANNGNWHLDGDTVVFKTTALTNQYNQLLANIK